MGFRCPRDIRDYFRSMLPGPDDANRFRLLFDPFYLCAVVGMLATKLGNDDDLEQDVFIDHYPEMYTDKSGVLASMLITAEMKRTAIQPNFSGSMEKLILNLVDYRSSTLLKPSAEELINQYAAGGIGIIRESIPKTTELETFLVHYCNLVAEYDA
jgi:hypothetical protein